MYKTLLILVFCLQNPLFSENSSRELHIPITLHETERCSSYIETLKKELANENPTALEAFWRVVQTVGTPLLEPLPENDQEMLTTFIWQSDQEEQTVVVASYGIASFDPFKNQMTHIPGTDVWYKSWILPRDARTVYSISPNDPLIAISDYRLDKCSFPSFTETWRPDPFNKQTYLIPASLCAGEQEQLMSLLEMPEAPKLPWLEETARYTKGTVLSCTVPSQTQSIERDIYVYLPPNYDKERLSPYPLVVSFDGFASKEMMKSPAILDYLIAQGKLPPTVLVMINNPSPNTVTRLFDLACHQPFFEYVAKDLISWVQNNYRVTKDPHQTVITGASLGGLASAYMGLIHPEIFGNVLAQSGAYFWLIQGEQDWLIHQYVQEPLQDVRFFLDVGSLETVPTFSNGLSILYANRYFRDILKAKGYPVKYVEFSGGHDYICWQKTFAEGLEYLLNP